MARLPLRRTGRTPAVVLVALLLVLVAFAPPASAHSELERSDPPNGGMMSPGRTGLTLWFSEPVTTRASSFALRMDDGQPVAVRVSTANDARGSVVRLATAPLRRGVYTMQWEVQSLEDGHTSGGSVRFGVGVRPAVLASTGGQLPAAPLLALRWIDLSLLVLAIGALAVSGRVLDAWGDRARGARRFASTVAASCVAAAVCAGLLAPLLLTPHEGNPFGTWLTEAWATLAGTRWGHVWVARELSLVVAAVALWSWLRRPLAVAAPRVAGAALVSAAWFEASAGHAASAGGPPLLLALAAVAHLTAGGVWAGGLVLLVITFRRTGRHDPGTPPMAIWRAFSPRAAVASVVVVATGLYESGRYVPDLGAVRTTVYGGMVAAKLALVAAALLLAGCNTLLVHPGLRAGVADRLGRSRAWTPVRPTRLPVLLSAEAGVLAAAVAVAALLTSVPTAREAVEAGTPTAPHVSNVDGLFVTFEALPGGPGRSQLVVRVRPTELPPPAPIHGVAVTVTGVGRAPETVPLERVEPGHYEASVATPPAGPATATVAVHRPGLVDAVSQSRWHVDAGSPEGVQPLEVALTVAAVLLLAGLAVSLLALRRRRHLTSRPGSSSPGAGPPWGPPAAGPDTVLDVEPGRALRQHEAANTDQAAV
jgi:copper transport protein